MAAAPTVPKAATPKAKAGHRCFPPWLADRLQDCVIAPRTVPGGAGQGRHRARSLGASVEFAEYREYAPGDPPNRIDWSVYARSDRVLVRRFEDETALRLHVVVDRTGSMAFTTGSAPRKLDHACQLAAGLLHVAVRQGDIVRLHILEQELRSGESMRSGHQLDPALRRLDALEPVGEGTVANALRSLAETGAERGLVVVIADLLEDPVAVLEGVRLLRHAGHRVHLWQVLDRAELQLDLAAKDGLLELSELETGRKLLVQVDTFRDAYRKEVQAHLERLRDGCAQADAGWRLCSTSVAVDEALRSGIRAL